MTKVCVIQINVTDMDKAIEFYCDKLGFEIATKEFYPELVSIKHEPYLILCKVEKPIVIDYPNMAQTLLNIQTDNLLDSMERLRSQGVEWLQDEPKKCPVGIVAAFRDPSGNVHEMIEFQFGK